MGGHPVTHQMEEYLEAMGRLQERDEAVTTSALARECKVSAPSTTQMLQKMSELGLVDYTPRGRVNLSPAGRKAAASVMRRHRLWERFLHDILGLRWDSVHEEACRLEHATSEHVEQHLADTLADYDTCPHGYRIPASGDEVKREAVGVPLSDLPIGRPAQILRVRDEAGPLLRKLEALGLLPGVVVSREEEPPGVPSEAEVWLRVGDDWRRLDRETASQVSVCFWPSPEVDALSEVGKAVASPPEDTPTLAALAPGECGRVEHLHGGRSFVGRCLALGFTPGVEVKVVQNSGRGPLIAQVRDVRVALGRGEAQKISVLRKG